MTELLIYGAYGIAAVFYIAAAFMIWAILNMDGRHSLRWAVFSATISLTWPVGIPITVAAYLLVAIVTGVYDEAKHTYLDWKFRREHMED